jgi:endonuclease III
VKNESTFAKKFTTAWKKIKSAGKPDPLPTLDPTMLIIVSFLEWNATRSKALAAQERLMAELIDLNDLRVSHHEELLELIADSHPGADERVARLLEVLHELYLREHGMVIESLAGKSKKIVKTYLDTLPGMPSYVASQVLLLAFGGHAVPVDDHMMALLRAEGCIDEEATVEETTAFLERQIKAADAVESHHILRAWADANATASKPAGDKPAKKSTGKSAAKSSSRSTAKSAPAPSTKAAKAARKTTKSK